MQSSTPGYPLWSSSIVARLVGLRRSLVSYYLARSSTRLHERLVRSSFFGPIIEEWSTYQGLSRRSKVKLIGLIAVAVGVSLSLVPLTPLVLAVTFVLSPGGLYSLLRLPGVDEEDESLPYSWIARWLPAPPPPSIERA